MMATAKLFQNGQSQAVRLPKEFRFENLKEVFIKKVNGMVVLMPKSDKTVWDKMFNNLDNFSDDFMETRTEPQQKREELF
ncbi:MAG: VapB protein (antitoxin to VapC) [uncultured Sulfurovum sp.]|uniref:VapB protein (Antitoxin to VapC) n=1 Tax=uncultured Sulfurovum sp. TaxID=269237 RepID=A0A6S6S7M6_9BACT|nr:MAG: VapB protein (antitoxin to VapC) [uncultured Sulfurovum sp.]CAA6824426.1 MAG: VapB protein (antitoxin to VapC) [uncultured Sulfurovum sp.]